MRSLNSNILKTTNLGNLKLEKKNRYFNWAMIYNFFDNIFLIKLKKDWIDLLG